MSKPKVLPICTKVVKQAMPLMKTMARFGLEENKEHFTEIEVY
jgi:hypothetical protein